MRMVKMYVRYRNNKPSIVLCKDRLEAMALRHTRFKDCKVRMLDVEEHTPGKIVMPSGATGLVDASINGKWGYKN